VADQFLSKILKPWVQTAHDKVNVARAVSLIFYASQLTRALLSFSILQHEQTAKLVRLTRILVKATSIQQLLVCTPSPTGKIVVLLFDLAPRCQLFSSPAPQILLERPMGKIFSAPLTGLSAR